MTTVWRSPLTHNTLYDIDHIFEKEGGRDLFDKFMEVGAWRGLLDSDCDEWHKSPVGKKWVVLQEILKASNITLNELLDLYINDCVFHKIQYRLTSLVTALHSYALVFVEAREVLIHRAKTKNELDWKTWASQWWDGKPDKINRSIDEPFEPSLQF